MIEKRRAGIHAFEMKRNTFALKRMADQAFVGLAVFQQENADFSVHGCNNDSRMDCGGLVCGLPNVFGLGLNARAQRQFV